MKNEENTFQEKLRNFVFGVGPSSKEEFDAAWIHFPHIEAGKKAIIELHENDESSPDIDF